MLPVETADGSLTCFNSEFQEHYHNLHGALQEAENLYVDSAKLEQRLERDPEVWILDPFFGLGYNTLACLKRFLEITTEKFPDARLNLLALECDPHILTMRAHVSKQSTFESLKPLLTTFEHNVYYQTQIDPQDFFQIGKENGFLPNEANFSFHLLVGDTRKILPQIPDTLFDVILHDPFSPRKQPELWTKQLFQQYKRILRADASVVITYSAAACVRRAIHEAGLFVYPTQHPLCKTGTLGFKGEKPDYSTLTMKDTALMNSKAGIPYQDSEDLSSGREAVLVKRAEEQILSTLETGSAIHRRFKS